MKISYNWLKEYIHTDLAPESVAEILTNTGLEVEGITALEVIKGGLKGVVVGEVVEKSAHPNADRLSVTKVDVGGESLLPIVCGAPNVAAGQKVLVATVGATLYPEGDENGFKIKKAKIRGEESMGMICAEDELGLGKSHDGIMVLPEDAKVGTPAAELLKLESDYIFEIGLTPNRSDAFCHFGVARDLAAFLRQKEEVELKYPDLTSFNSGSEGDISIKIEATSACLRYSGLLIENVTVQPSPEWLQKKLRSIGLTPKNVVVDVTNFVLHELGQPLHAFDASKIRGNEVKVKFYESGTKFTTLDGIERELSNSDLMIGDAEGPMCIAGVLGGSNSGVTETTTSVFLESACFHPATVRRTAKRHQVNTDASFRFERGVDPNEVVNGLKRAAMLIAELAGGKITTPVIDHYPEQVQPKKIQFSIPQCYQLIGQEIPVDEITAILRNLDFEILEQKEDQLFLAVPTYRVDVSRQADVVEEILRIYGYDRIELPEKISASVNVSEGVDKEYLHNLIADLLVSDGFLQMMSNSLTSSTALAKLAAAEFPERTSVKILNPLSSELDVMRQTLLVNMLEAVELNQNHKNKDLRLFEFGNIYQRTAEGIHEEMQLGLLLTGLRYPESWNNPKESVSYYDLRNQVNVMLQRLGLHEKCRFQSGVAGYLADGQSILCGKNVVGQLGWVKPEVTGQFDIQQTVFFAVVNWSLILKEIGDGTIRYQRIGKFPVVRRDFSLLLDQSVTFEAIAQLARKTGKELLKEVGLFDVYEGPKLDAGKKSYAVRFSLSADKTLTDSEVDDVMSRIREALEKKLGATLR